MRRREGEAVEVTAPTRPLDRVTPAERRAPLGFGLGLRPVHYEAILTARADVDWFEAITENYLVGGGRPLQTLEQIRRDYPVVLHGVSLSIGSTDPLDTDYLERVAALARRIEPAWVSDHLCFTGAGGLNLHDLLPLPYTEEALAHVAKRIECVQERLQRPLVIENVSAYVAYSVSTMSEWDFLSRLVERTGCRLLLDVNNVYVSSRNHGFDPIEFLDGLPRDAVVQFHIAGHEDHGTHVIDTHDAPVADAVWRLYEAAIRRFPGASTLLERDDRIPPLDELVEELRIARRLAAAAGEVSA